MEYARARPASSGRGGDAGARAAPRFRMATVATGAFAIRAPRVYSRPAARMPLKDGPMIRLLEPDEIATPVSGVGPGPDQPARRALAIRALRIAGAAVPVETRDLMATPFCTLVSLRRTDRAGLPAVLVVTPLSGNFAIGQRDLVSALLPDFHVHLTDWTNVRHAPLREGRLGLDESIETVRAMLLRIGPGCGVFGLCQGGVAALAAAALMAEDAEPAAPAALALAGAPIDPAAAPTRVARALAERPIGWFRDNVIRSVPGRYAGRGRPVYPAETQLTALTSYLARRAMEGGEVCRMILGDERAGPDGPTFLDTFRSVMDIDARHFLDNIERVFHARALALGRFAVAGRPVEPRALARTPLLALEGERDDIAAPGQTAAAVALCGAGEARVLRGCGHFDLFHGSRFRQTTLPVLAAFLARAGDGRASAAS